MHLLTGREAVDQCCPQCRGAIRADLLIPVSAFLKKHGPQIKDEKLPEFYPELIEPKSETCELSDDLTNALNFNGNALSHSFSKRLAKSHKNKDKISTVNKYKKTWITSSKITKMIQKLIEVRDEGLGEKTIGK